MATGFLPAVANAVLDCYFNATNITAPANVYVKLHVGDPGAALTSNAATETTRKEVTCSAASGGAITSDAAMTWTSGAGTEDYTYFSVWNHVSAGTAILSGTVTANAVVAGDTFTVATGDFDLALSVAS